MRGEWGVGGCGVGSKEFQVVGQEKRYLNLQSMWFYEWMNERMDEWMNENGRMDTSTH